VLAQPEPAAALRRAHVHDAPSVRRDRHAVSGLGRREQRLLRWEEEAESVDGALRCWAEPAPERCGRGDDGDGEEREGDGIAASRRRHDWQSRLCGR
jgi:hypothetical protein